MIIKFVGNKLCVCLQKLDDTYSDIGLFHYLSVQGDGRKIPGLVKSRNFQRSTAKSPKIPGGWQHFATKFIEIEIFTLTDFSRQSCC